MRTIDDDQSAMIDELTRAAEHGGIATYVQSIIHSTTIGVEETKAFLEKLIISLERCIQTRLLDHADLSHVDETQLGSLLSASSSALRYVTEQRAMIPLLPRFWTCFVSALRHPSNTRAILGIKMVAMMGVTRALEAFGEHIDVKAVIALLDNTQALWAQDGDWELNAYYLLRPVSELVNVAVQTHPDAHRIIFCKLLPMWMELIPRCHSCAMVTNPVKLEMLNTIVVMLETCLPKTVLSNDWTHMLPMPSFTIRDREDDSETVDLQADFAEIRRALAAVSCDTVAYTLSEWIKSEEMFGPVSLAFPLVCHVESLDSSRCGTRSAFGSMLQSLQEQLLATTPRTPTYFERLTLVADGVSGLLRRVKPMQREQLEQLYTMLLNTLSRIEEPMRSDALTRAELRSVKASYINCRVALTKAFVMWMHSAERDQVIDRGSEIVRTVAGRLVEPRIFGDLIYLIRIEGQEDEQATEIIELVGQKLHRALDQVEKYSKDSALKILKATGRFAVGCGLQIAPLADLLINPLMALISEPATAKIKRNACIEAMACIILQLELEDLDKASWCDSFFDSILSNAIEGKDVDLQVLHGVVAQSAAARVCISKHLSNGVIIDYFTSLLVRTFSVWPLYDEDVEVVSMLCEILVELTDADNRNRSILSNASLQAALVELRERASEDQLVELSILVSKLIEHAEPSSISN